MYFDFFVNGVILVLFCLFIYFSFGNRKKIRASLENKKVRSILIMILWTLLVVGIGLSIYFYPALDRGHDINDAVEAASRHFIEGGNPYGDEVIPRFSERYHGPDTEIKNDTYNYLPVSLFFYTGSYLILEHVGTYWFPLTNLILGLITAFVAWRTFPRAPIALLLPLISIVSLFFMFDNIMLTLFLVSISMYFLVRSRHKYRYFFALSFLFLGVFVKMLGVIALAALFLYLIQRYRFKKKNVNIQLIVFVILSITIAMAMVLPFGFQNVADSTVFYFSDVENRTSTSGYGGTLLTVILGDSPLFSIISDILLVVIVFGSLLIKGLYRRMFVSESLLVLITIKASQAIIVVPLYILLVIILKTIYSEIDDDLGSLEKKKGKITEANCHNRDPS